MRRSRQCLTVVNTRRDALALLYALNDPKALHLSTLLCGDHRRQVVAEVGPLDEAYFMYSEEVDWCFRIHRRGWGVAYLPQAQALHIAGASAHRQPERRRAQVYRSKCIFVRKHWGTWQAALFVGLIRCMSATKLIAWWARSLVGERTRREAAASQTDSYRFLLSTLSSRA